MSKRPRQIFHPPRSFWVDFWAPVVFLGVFLVLVVGVAYSARQAQLDRLAMETRVTAEQTRLRLEAWIDARVGMLSLVAGRWQSVYRDDPNAFRAEARRLLEFYPGLQALNWIDADWVIRIVVPVAGNEDALDKDLHLHPCVDVRLGLKRATESRAVAQTGVISLLQGGQGIATYHPVYLKGDPPGRLPIGFINGVFRIGHLMDSCLHEQGLRERFDLELLDDKGALVHRRGGIPTEEIADFSTDVSLRVVGRTWVLRVTPSVAYLGENGSAVPLVVLLIGVGFALSLSFALWLQIGSYRTLLQREDLYKTLFDASGDAILLLQGDEFVDCNIKSLEFFGRTREAIIGSKPWELSPSQQEDGVSSRLSALAEIGRVRSDAPVFFEWTHQRADGAAIEVEITLTELMLWGKSVLLCVLHDIGPRKQVERERLQIQERMTKMQRLEDLGLFAGSIAHDFNNILQVIQGHTELVERYIGEPERARGSLVEVENAALKAAELCQQLLAYSGRGRFDVALVDLGALVRDMGVMLRVALPKKVILTMEVEEDLPMIEAEASQMQQIAMNLLVNAAESFGGESGEVRVGVDLVEISDPIEPELYHEPPPAAGGYVRLMVRDRGQGMDEESRRSAFEPFFTTKARGRGLGLAAVLGIVRSHAGALLLRSRLGEGTVFELFFPVSTARSQVSRPVTPCSLSAVSREGLVLLVDDEKAVVDVGRRILEELGYEVVTARDGREALEVFRRHAERLAYVILDLTMPYLNGDEVYAELRRSHPVLPVVICSGYEESDVSGDRICDPYAAFLKKPYVISELLASMQIVSSGEG